MLTSVASFIRARDVFGHPIGLNYKSSGSFQTLLGGIVTIACLGLIIANTVAILTNFIDRSTQTETIRRV